MLNAVLRSIVVYTIIFVPVKHISSNAPYGNRTRSNTVTGCRANLHTHEAEPNTTGAAGRHQEVPDPHCPRQESNLDLELRTLAWSPFHHRDGRNAERRVQNECLRILHSSFCIPLLLPSPGLEPGTRRSKRRVMSSFTTRASRSPPRRAPRARPAMAGFVRRRRAAPTLHAENKKPRGPHRVPGFKFSSKRWNPGHPVKARRSVRDSAPDKGAHAPPPVRRGVPQSEAGCRDWMNMDSTMKTDSNKRVLQYVSASERKSISFFGDSPHAERGMTRRQETTKVRRPDGGRGGRTEPVPPSRLSSCAFPVALIGHQGLGVGVSKRFTILTCGPAVGISNSCDATVHPIAR